MSNFFPLSSLFALLLTTRAAFAQSIDKKVDDLLKKMTLDEKIGQLNQYNGDWEATGPVTKDVEDKMAAIRQGKVGSILNITGVAHTKAFQQAAMDSRLKIPLLFGQDVIHGYSITFPIPLAEAASWEKAIRKMRTGLMPPPGEKRPSRTELDAFAGELEGELDAAAKRHIAPGVTSLHRLNRTEYGNVIHDLLDLDIDVTSLLPADDEANGFDNIADVLRVSPSLLEQYLSASRKISNATSSASSIALRRRGGRI